MSKNFELLQSLSREQGLFDTGADLSSLPVLTALPDLSQLPLPDTSSPLHRESDEKATEHPVMLEMEEKQRDEIMKFVQHVFMMPGTGAPRTVVLTSAEPGNGCSWICCRAAATLAAQAVGPVCMVDANLRSPALHQTFAVENHYGLSNALKSTESIRNFVRPLGQQNLWLLSCGADATKSQSLVLSDPMRLRLAELRQYFEYVLVDAPALTVGSDALALGRSADGVVLVIRANASRRESARKAVQDLQNAGARVLGAVLNQRTFPIPQAIYTKL
jgi:capsular exopolysaccharide synthesis family protein